MRTTPIPPPGHVAKSTFGELAARFCAALNKSARVQVFSADGWETATMSHVLEVLASWAEPVPLGFRVAPDMHTEVRSAKAPP